MRTTLTLDPDVAQMPAETAHRQHRSFKHVLNDAIRRGLTLAVTRGSKKPYRVVPHRTQLLPGLDSRSFNKLVDELEIESATAKLRRRR